MTGKYMIDLVLPAYNEASNIEQCVNEVKKELDTLPYSYKLIIAEDGSTDGTDRIASRLAKGSKSILHLHNDNKLGRGRALRNAFAKAEGDIVAYIDVDGATDITYLKKLLGYTKTHDVVTGSRYLPGSIVSERPASRVFASRVHSILLRVLLGCDIHDPQCGFKAFSKKFAKKEIPQIRENSWAWDEIVLVEAVKKGYKVKEFPVKWEERKVAAHSGSFRRILKDTKLHGTAILKLFLKWRLRLNITV